MNRAIEHWRAYPHLRIREAATVAGISPRAMESYLAKMEVRWIGNVRFVTTESFRRWLGEDVPEEAKPGAVVSLAVRRKAAKVMREMA